jgi:hypothetical protein
MTFVRECTYIGIGRLGKGLCGGGMITCARYFQKPIAFLNEKIVSSLLEKHSSLLHKTLAM